MMAMGIYSGAGDKARSVASLYIGVNGTARKVQRVYVGVAGVARLVSAEAEPQPIRVFQVTLSWSDGMTGQSKVQHFSGEEGAVYRVEGTSRDPLVHLNIRPMNPWGADYAQCTVTVVSPVDYGYETTLEYIPDGSHSYFYRQNCIDPQATFKIAISVGGTTRKADETP